jgi:YidC/Oxa1 family membrane protein insertase
MDTQRLILFIVFSFSALLLWDAWQKEQHPAPVKPVVAVSQQQSPQPSAAPGTPAQVAVTDTGLATAGAKLKVQTDAVYAEVDTVGGDLRRLELLKQHDALDPKKNFTLFQDTGGRTYAAQTGLIDSGLPNHKAVFTAAPGSYTLLPGQNTVQVKLSWHDTRGILVEKVYTFHRDSYVIDVTYRIQNNSGAPVQPFAYYQLVRDGEPPVGNPRFISTYTGPAVYTEKEKFQKVSFADIDKGKVNYPKQSPDGWIGMLQHYFVSAWLPEGAVTREFYTRRLEGGLYAAGVIVPVGTIGAGQTKELGMRLYAGPEERKALTAAAPGLDLTVDYGWLTVIAAPLAWVLGFIHKWVNNWGVAIILLTVLIKLAFYPLSAKSYRSMAGMRVLGPKLQKLKEQYGDDRQRLHQAMMDLYKTEKINPLGGCLPIVVQIPVFIALYWVLLSSVEMRQAPFMLWIHDLSSPDPFYVLPIVMGITMLIQTKLNPTPPDPIQAKVMMVMPVAFSVFFFFFPAGLVLYWLVNNVLSISQQWYITRSIEKVKAAKGHAKQ